MPSRTGRGKQVEAPRFDEFARTALLETTSSANVGAWVAEEPRPESTQGAEIVDVVFANEQSGYRGWSWVVTVAVVDGEAPTVMELALMPGDDALLAPEWIPWSVRLAEWQAQQLLLAEAAGVDADELDADDSDDDDEDDVLGDDDSDDDDVLDDDDDEADDDGPRSTHSGDIDGVDIDDLDSLDED